jgi:hypothetical protein
LKAFKMDKPQAQAGQQIETARAKLASIDTLLDEVMKHIQNWFQTGDRVRNPEREVIELQAYNLRNSVAAFSQRALQLDSPFFGRLLAAQDLSSMRIGPKAECIVETDDAYNEEKLTGLGSRDIRDAIEFDTEFKDMFGLAWIDDEIGQPLTDALELLVDMLEDGNATVPGMVVKCLKTVLKGHPRGFGHYFSGEDHFPRPSVVVQVEIDERMPEALRWLRFELQEAIEREGNSEEPVQHLGARDLSPSLGHPDRGSSEALFMLRPRSEKPEPTMGKLITAINLDTYSGNPSQLAAEFEGWWADCCSRISGPNVEWCKSGAVMWDHLKFQVPANWVAFALSLKSADENMVRAAMAAVFSAAATTVGPVCIDSLFYTLATFIHASPAFRDVVEEGVWHLPFGDRTAYCVSTAPAPDEN